VRKGISQIEKYLSDTMKSDKKMKPEDFGKKPNKIFTEVPNY